MVGFLISMGTKKNWDFESETEHIVVVFQMKLGTMNEIQS